MIGKCFSFFHYYFLNSVLEIWKNGDHPPTLSIHLRTFLRSKKINNISRLCCIEHFWYAAWTCHLQMQITNWPLILRMKPLFQSLPKMKNEQFCSFIIHFRSLDVALKCIFIGFLIPRISFLEWLSEKTIVFLVSFSFFLSFLIASASFYDLFVLNPLTRTELQKKYTKFLDGEIN